MNDMRTKRHEEPRYTLQKSRGDTSDDVPNAIFEMAREQFSILFSHLRTCDTRSRSTTKRKTDEINVAIPWRVLLR